GKTMGVRPLADFPLQAAVTLAPRGSLTMKSRAAPGGCADSARAADSAASIISLRARTAWACSEAAWAASAAVIGPAGCATGAGDAFFGAGGLRAIFFSAGLTSGGGGGGGAGFRGSGGGGGRVTAGGGGAALRSTGTGLAEGHVAQTRSAMAPSAAASVRSRRGGASAQSAK